jgi:putative endopeptidase
MTRKLQLMTGLFAFTLSAVAQTSTSAPSAAPHHGIDLTAMDTSVKPGDDFYRYADGAWIARTEIPADRAGLSVFSTLGDRSSKQVASII